MNKKVTLLAMASIVASPAVFATNGYQLTGIGAYQKSLGGAVTAKPGSAMTAITNPAGMAKIGNRADFSLEMFMPERYVDFTAIGGEKNNSKSENYGVPALGWTAPVEEGSDIYFGGGIYGTSGMGTDYPETQFAAPGVLGPDAVYFEGYSSIQFWQMAPTIAWKHDDKLTLGVSLNIDYQSVAFKQAFRADTDASGSGDQLATNFDLSRTAQAFGLGLSLGALYDVNDKLTVGASYKSKQNFSDLEYQLSEGAIMDFTGQMMIQGCDVPGGKICPSGTYSMSLDFPAMYAVGLAYDMNDKLSLSFDIKLIEWSSTISQLTIKGPNGERIILPAGWEDQTIFALGAEYFVNEKFTLRAGYNHADMPFDEAYTDSNYILPAVTQSHIAFGGDYKINKHWGIGFHGSKAHDETLVSPNTGSKIGLGITTFGINLGYTF